MLITDYIKGNRLKDIFGIIEGISAKISDNVYRPFHREQDIIDKKIKEIYHKPEPKLSDISPWLDVFVYIKKYNFKNVKNEIFGFIYENYLKELFEEEEKGQYFTDPAIVNFMINEIGYNDINIKKKIFNNQEDKISIIDPSCGSGTFLYTAVNSIVDSISDGLEASKKIEALVSNNVFGLDIEEFPLYLAEMSMIMRLLPIIINKKYNNPLDKKIKLFLTKDSIAEFSDINDKEENKNIISFLKDNQRTLLEPQFNSFMRDDQDIKEMKLSIKNSQGIPRRRFDYVIGNPPYIGYNMCSKQGLLSFELLKKGKIKLNNIYGMNLHSTPNNPKRYRPNPNLYVFFIALGLRLLKYDGKICYIIPQTLLTAGDLDVARYHLAKNITMEKIFIFNSHLFIERGLKQNKIIPTSSLIFIAKNKEPPLDNEVEIIVYKGKNDSLKDVLNNIKNQNKIDIKKVSQNELIKNFDNWNYIANSDLDIKFLAQYIRNSEDISIYYNHKIAKVNFNSLFYFDSGYSIDENKMLEAPIDDGEYYKFPKLNEDFFGIHNFIGYWKNIRSGKGHQVIKLRQANQGYNLLDSKYKIIWSYVNPNKFHFTSSQIIWARNRYCSIGTINKNELLYIAALLNSKIIKKILNLRLKTNTERDFLVSTSSIKSYVRVPKVGDNYSMLKQKIIELTEDLLKLEESKLSQYINFSDILIQELDKIDFDKDYIIFVSGNDHIKRKIKHNAQFIHNLLKNKGILKKEKINLTDLKNMTVIDFEKQKELKDYIDDLIFSLYFDIDIKKFFHDKNKVKELCKKNSFYKIVEDSLNN